MPKVGLAIRVYCIILFFLNFTINVLTLKAQEGAVEKSIETKILGHNSLMREILKNQRELSDEFKKLNSEEDRLALEYKARSDKCTNCDVEKLRQEVLAAKEKIEATRRTIIGRMDNNNKLFKFEECHAKKQLLNELSNARPIDPAIAARTKQAVTDIQNFLVKEKCEMIVSPDNANTLPH